MSDYQTVDPATAGTAVPAVALVEAPVAAPGAAPVAAKAAPDAAPRGTASLVERAFTVKSIACGVVGGLAVGWATNFNNNVLHGPDLIGNHLPVGPLALIMILGVVWNPTFGRLRALRFSPREMTVTLALMLMCCWLPSSGFFRYFHRLVARPVIEQSAHPGWQQQQTVERIPERLFPLRRGAERMAQVDALRAVPTGDPALRLVLDELPPDLLGTATIEPDAARRTEDATRARIAAHAAGDSAWRPAQALVEGLPALVPADADAGPYAVAFRDLRERYRELLPAARREDQRVYGGFVQSLSVGDHQVPVGELPWKSWLAPMAYWCPFVLLFMVCILAMSLVVHRQWSRHEQLSYPLATVTTALVARSPGRLVPDILGQRLFWWGFVPVLALHMCNYAAVWFPESVPRVDLSWGFGGEMKAIFPVLNNVGEQGAFSGRLSFMLVGLAYFISSEMSLSMGLSSILLLLVGVQVYSTTGGSVDQDSARAGAYIAYAAMLLWSGRSYYLLVGRQALGLRRHGADDREQVWAARLFIAAFAAFVVLLATVFAMDWFIALLFAATVMVLFLVFTRIICETGAPFMQVGWGPASLLASTLGFSALGSLPLVMVCYLAPFLTVDPRESLMPYVATSLKVAENTGVRRWPLATLGFAAMAIAFVVCFIAWTKSIYQDGSGGDGWANMVPGIQLDLATRGLTVMSDTGQQAAADATHGLAKLGLVSFTNHTGEVLWIAIGAALVVGFSMLRFSFAWWPLHPVLLLVWGTYPAQCSWPSFLLGWAIKVLIVRFAGGRAYTQLKPLFIGIVLGEVFAIAMVLGIGYLSYAATGRIPRSYWVLFG